MDPSTGVGDYVVIPILRKGETPDDPTDIPARIEELRSEMLLAAEDLEFEKAAELRDQVEQLRGTALHARTVLEIKAFPGQGSHSRHVS